MNWKEDEYNQVKHCEHCNEPILLVDWLKNRNRTNFRQWDMKRMCDLDNGNQVRCKHGYRSLKLEEARPRLDMNHMKHLLIQVRESLGISRVDTESTFDGWDICSLDIENGVQGREALADLYSYCLSLKRDEGYYDRRMSSGYRQWGLALLISVINKTFPDEVRHWPLWSLAPQTRNRLGIKNNGFNEPKLFDRMLEEMYGGKPTFDDMQTLSNNWTYGRELRHMYPWLPSTRNSSHWEFVSNFQKYFCTEEFIFNYADFKLLFPISKNATLKNRRLTLEDCKYWFFNYLCKEYSIELNQDVFPYKSSNDELQQVINITMEDIRTLPAARKVQIALFGKPSSKSIRSIVKTLWPDYEIDENLWNRMLLSERRMSGLIERVLRYHGIEDYQYSESITIPTRTGRTARYLHSMKNVKVDGISRILSFIVEGQGDYHYVDRTYGIERWDGCNWDDRIPKCYSGNSTTALEYKQEQDAKCKRAITRHGFSPVYVVLSRFGRPVTRVHGEIPMWNKKYITGNRDVESIGLAETFDLQGRKDIGDMIRNYYHNVVMKMTKEMKRELEE